MRLFFISFFLILFFQALPASAGQPFDISFLRDEPYRKTKQKVDVSSVKTEEDLLTIKATIDSAMALMVAISFVEPAPAVEKELLTDHGRLVLRLPPLRNAFKRYSVAHISNWHVCGDAAVSFNAVFSDLLQRDFWQETFLFVRSVDGWRFEDHREAKCK